MQHLLKGLMVLMLPLMCLATPANARLDISIGFPGVSLGINQPMFPEFVRIPYYKREAIRTCR